MKDQFLLFTFYSCLLLTLSGCGSLFSKAPAPDYYQIDYPYEPSACDKPFPGAVRLWPFSAAAPFDREEMIATSPSLQVRFSPHYKWVSPVGDMVANNLMRDLSFGKIFEDVVPAGDPMAAEYGIGGQIYRFALEENGSSPHALLDLEISLWQEKPRTVIFRRHFHYESPPLTSTGPDDFARAMAGLASKLSTDLRNDLCTIMQDSSHPAGH
ncbi:MAG TPA: ABC-type transport auxiliary lipoprotein family protein [Syntrophobacteraceae bacterium]|nr:ABC-type transport auxiliary lipoprotein family protein [Syntrophobacteraceae bacterium]